MHHSNDKLGICTYKGIPASANKKIQQWLYALYYPSLDFFAERCIYALLSTNGCFNLAEVKRKFSKEVRDSKEIKEVRERNNFVCIRI